MDPEEFREFFKPSQFAILRRRFKNKIELIEHLFQRCIEGTELTKNRAAILQTLLEREESMSTGIGMGLAIPHCSSEYIPEARAYVAILREGINFQSVDNKLVQIVVLLLLPKKHFDRHIHLLAMIARIFNNQGIRRKVLAVSKASQLYQIFQKAIKDE